MERGLGGGGGGLICGVGNEGKYAEERGRICYE